MARPTIYTHKIPRLYTAWLNMRRRCREDKQCYLHVTVCDEWQTFEVFQSWSLANGYNDQLTLDRIDNRWGYYPENCRWVGWQAQQRNRRSNKPVTAFGETKLIIEWLEDPRCVVREKALYSRLSKGWDAEYAIAAPTFSKCPPGAKGCGSLSKTG